jgi:tetratricopeptide (TPR) repeat protein
MPAARAAAQKALALDPTLARPHAVLGLVKIVYDWDFFDGEAELRKAIELEPNDATAHQWLGQLLGYIGGREQEAIDETTRAHQLDPLAPEITFAMAEAYVNARQVDKGVEIYRKLVADEPQFAGSYLGLAWASLSQRNYQEYAQNILKYGRLAANKNYEEFGAAMEAGYRAGGWPAAARKAIETLRAQRETKANYLASYTIAQMYATLGDQDQAFQWLNTAREEKDLWLVLLRTDPVFDPLRSDPRYADLVKKIGYPK